MGEAAVTARAKAAVRDERVGRSAKTTRALPLVEVCATHLPQRPLRPNWKAGRWDEGTGTAGDFLFIGARRTPPGPALALGTTETRVVGRRRPARLLILLAISLARRRGSHGLVTTCACSVATRRDGFALQGGKPRPVRGSRGPQPRKDLRGNTQRKGVTVVCEFALRRRSSESLPARAWCAPEKADRSHSPLR